MPLSRILVVGNYLPDHQQSMIRFAHLLATFYDPVADVRLVKPFVFVGRLSFLPQLLKKYLAYIDKLILFPIWLSIRSRSYDLVHIADHGNSPYAFCCPPHKCIITCHDLLAVRASMGDSTTACEASPTGALLQKLILAGLRRAHSLTFVSQATFDDFLRIAGRPFGQRHAVIPNSLNAQFLSDISTIALSPEEQSILPASPFILMVGSSHPRKNRRLALRLLLELGNSSPYIVVFAGESLSPDDQSFILEHNLASRVQVIVCPSHALLNKLYILSHALLFPSFAEGFGWPLIEAQACGSPVIASCTTSIPEVAGNGALFADPLDVATFALYVRSLEDPDLRSRLIHNGFSNIRRFDPQLIKASFTAFALDPMQSTL